MKRSTLNQRKDLWKFSKVYISKMPQISIEDFDREAFLDVSLSCGIPFVIVFVCWVLVLEFGFNWRPVLNRKFVISNFLKVELESIYTTIVEVLFWIFYASPFALCLLYGIMTAIRIKPVILGVDLAVAPSSLMLLLATFMNYNRNGNKISSSVTISMGISALLMIVLTFLDTFFLSEKSWMGQGYLWTWPPLLALGFYSCFFRDRIKKSEMKSIIESEESKNSFVSKLKEKQYDEIFQGSSYIGVTGKIISCGIILATSFVWSFIYSFLFWDSEYKNATISTSVGSFIVDLSLVALQFAPSSPVNNTLLMFCGFAVKAIGITFSARFYMIGHGFIFLIIGSFFLTRFLYGILSRFINKSPDGIEDFREMNDEVVEEVKNSKHSTDSISISEMTIDIIIYATYAVALGYEIGGTSSPEKIFEQASGIYLDQKSASILCIIFSVAISIIISLWMVNKVTPIKVVLNIAAVILVLAMYFVCIFATDLRVYDLQYFVPALFQWIVFHLVSLPNLDFSHENIKEQFTDIYNLGALVISVASLVVVSALSAIGEVGIAGTSIYFGLLALYLVLISALKKSRAILFHCIYGTLAAVSIITSFFGFSLTAIGIILVAFAAVICMEIGYVFENQWLLCIPPIILLIVAAALPGIDLFLKFIMVFILIIVIMAVCGNWVRNQFKQKWIFWIFIGICVLGEIGSLIGLIFLSKSTFLSLTILLLIIFLGCLFSICYRIFNRENASSLVFTNIFFPVRNYYAGELHNFKLFGTAFVIVYAAPWLWGVFASVFFVMPWFAILAMSAAICICMFIIFGLLIDFDVRATQGIKMLNEPSINYVIKKSMESANIHFGVPKMDPIFSTYDEFVEYTNVSTSYSFQKSNFISSFRGQLYITSDVSFHSILLQIREYFNKNNVEWPYIKRDRFSLEQREELIQVYFAIEATKSSENQKMREYDDMANKAEEERRKRIQKLLDNADSNSNGGNMKPATPGVAPTPSKITPNPKPAKKINLKEKDHFYIGLNDVENVTGNIDNDYSEDEPVPSNKVPSKVTPSKVTPSKVTPSKVPSKVNPSQKPAPSIKVNPSKKDNGPKSKFLVESDNFEVDDEFPPWKNKPTPAPKRKNKFLNNVDGFDSDIDESEDNQKPSRNIPKPSPAQKPTPVPVPAPKPSNNNKNNQSNQNEDEPPILINNPEFNPSNKLTFTSSEYSGVISRFQQTKQKYSDQNWYPQISTCRADMPHLLDARYKRLEDLYPIPMFGSKGVTPGDVQQGSLGDCYFIAAMSSLASNPSEIEGLFCHLIEPQKTGAACVGLTVFSKKLPVVVDTTVPCTLIRGKPKFSQPRTNTSGWWGMLLEKAYAKMIGSFDGISGGQCHRAFALLSTGIPGMISLKEDEGKEMVANGQLWRLLRDLTDSGSYICCGSNSGSDTEKNSYGVVLGHAYSILRAVDIKGFKLLQLRNPWGDGEWNGAWSDGSSLWSIHQDVALALKHTNEDDGLFWICFEDFIQNYTSVYYLDRAKSMNLYELRGSLDSSAGDGASAFTKDAPSVTTMRNFAVRIPSQTEFKVMLEQSGEPSMIRCVMQDNKGKPIDRLYAGRDSRQGACYDDQSFNSWTWKFSGPGLWSLALFRDAKQNSSKYNLKIWSDAKLEISEISLNTCSQPDVEIEENVIGY